MSLGGAALQRCGKKIALNSPLGAEAAMGVSLQALSVSLWVARVE